MTPSQPHTGTLADVSVDPAATGTHWPFTLHPTALQYFPAPHVFTGPHVQGSAVPLSAQVNGPQPHASVVVQDVGSGFVCSHGAHWLPPSVKPPSPDVTPPESLVVEASGNVTPLEPEHAAKSSPTETVGVIAAKKSNRVMIRDSSSSTVLTRTGAEVRCRGDVRSR